MPGSKRQPIPYRRHGGPEEPKRPWLELYIGGIPIRYYALVDSGSDYSVIPLDLARRIGLQFDESQPEEGAATGGQSFRYWEATNQLAIQTEVGGLTFDEAMVAEGDDFILGRHDFFRRYRVSFNEPAQEFEIEAFDPNDGRSN
ncbi:MAG: retroviral-like aspartic protease family protein [Candidatus Rokubacteria bacterium]|nr:retroviral-like aspartic protease family protein [Candidatus Rokubacteria bacterium]